MEANPVELPFLSNIGLMMTYKCTIACPHCIVEAGPHRTEAVTVAEAANWLDQIAEYRQGHIKGLALTGGEPFHDLETLAKVSGQARALGLIVSVVTNAFWATSRETALRVLSELPDIQMVSISTDVYHQRSIPFGQIQHAIGAARALDRAYNVAVCTENEHDEAYLRIVQELDAMGEGKRIRPSITFPVGRAAKSAHRYAYETSSQPTVSACSMASSPVLFPDGNVVACIGPLLTLPPTHPLYLGNLNRESLAEILDRAEVNPILHTIRAWGPHKLVELLSQNGHGDLLPKQYLANCLCDACYKVLSDGRLASAIQEILSHPPMRDTVAYARLYYLKESRMAELYQL
jgi:MoaA/NifB/PqqE/SkfB family radical SAM enzyme